MAESGKKNMKDLLRPVLVSPYHINMQVNGVSVKAFVDSGALSSIVSKKCAERCRLLRHIDHHYECIAHGVGHSKILGLVPSTLIRFGCVSERWSLLVLDSHNMEFRFGVDMLSKLKCIIDFKENVLRVDDEEVPLLSEKDIPKCGEQSSDMGSRGESSRGKEMRICVMTELNQIIYLDVDADTTVLDVKEELQEMTEEPIERQQLIFKRRKIKNTEKLSELGVKDEFLTMVVSSTDLRLHSDGSAVNPEGFQQHIRRSSKMKEQLCQTGLEEVALDHDLNKLQGLLRKCHRQRCELQGQEDEKFALRYADPFDVKAQCKIEAAISQVTPYYVDMNVNGFALKALVDSAAQSSIISKSCATQCGLLKDLDKRYEGIAHGVGQSKILGRTPSLIKIGDASIIYSFFVLDSPNIEFVFGVDLLSKLKCVIDFKENVLRIGDGEFKVPLLPEKDIDEERQAKRAKLASNTITEGTPEATNKNTSIPAEGQSSVTGGTHGGGTQGGEFESMVAKLVELGFGIEAEIQGDENDDDESEVDIDEHLCEGLPMLEVFQVFINSKSPGGTCHPDGKIIYTDGLHEYELYKGYGDKCERITSGQSIPLTVPSRYLPATEFDIDIDLKDKVNGYTISKGTISFNSYDLYNDYDKHIEEVFGLATVSYVVWYDAVGATVKVRSIYRDNIAPVNVHGVVSAWSDKFDESPQTKTTLFKKSMDECKMANPSAVLPLSRPVVAVPLDFCLIISADLKAGDHEIARGIVEFPVVFHGTAQRTISGDYGLIVVEVAFSL